MARADWDEMQRLMHKSFVEAQGGDPRRTPSGILATRMIFAAGIPDASGSAMV